MPLSDAQGKEERLYLLLKLFDQPGRRLRTNEIAEKLGVSDDTAKRYIEELSATGRLPLRKAGQFWILAEHGRIEQLQIHLSVAEAPSDSCDEFPAVTVPCPLSLSKYGFRDRSPSKVVSERLHSSRVTV